MPENFHWLDIGETCWVCGWKQQQICKKYYHAHRMDTVDFARKLVNVGFNPEEVWSRVKLYELSK